MNALREEKFWFWITMGLVLFFIAAIAHALHAAAKNRQVQGAVSQHVYQSIDGSLPRGLHRVDCGCLIGVSGGQGGVQVKDACPEAASIMNQEVQP